MESKRQKEQLRRKNKRRALKAQMDITKEDEFEESFEFEKEQPEQNSTTSEAIVAEFTPAEKTPNHSTASAGANAMQKKLARENSNTTLAEFITKKEPGLAGLPQLSTDPKGVKEYLRIRFGLPIA